MITKVTVTGADDSVNHAELAHLYMEYPFVEFGILVSRKSSGTPRFPTKNWLSKLLEIKTAVCPDLKLAAHVCGSYVDDFARGDYTFVHNDLKGYWAMFDRIQVNTHGVPRQWSIFSEQFIKRSTKEFIFQYDENIKDYMSALANKGAKNINALFDLSHGKGILPEEWPAPFNLANIGEVKCGYAGGLSPDNLHGQIKLIESRSGERPVWIDMETHLRSNNGLNFDLGKVRKCLDISSSFVQTLTEQR